MGTPSDGKYYAPDECCPDCGDENMPTVEEVILVLAQYWPKDWRQSTLFPREVKNG